LATYSWALDQARSPIHSLKIVSSSSALTRWMTQTTRIAAQAGRIYTSRVWARTAGLAGSVRLSLTFWNAAGSYLGVTADSPPLGGTQVWTQLSVSQPAPPGTAYVRIEMRQTGVGTSWWDDLELTVP
jgi:hypothetical protein